MNGAVDPPTVVRSRALGVAAAVENQVAPVDEPVPCEPYLPRVTAAELYRREYRGLLRFAYVLTGDAQTAEDLVHDVWIKVAPKLDRVAEPVPYLRRALVNAAHSLHRRRIVMRRHAETGPGVHLDDHELSEFRDALLTLRPQQRAAIVLRYLYQCPDDEIAVVIGCRRATVRSLVHRGLASLRSELT